MFASKKLVQRLLCNSTKSSMQVMRASQPAFMATQSVRMFSGLDQISSGASKLGKALEKEVKYENENYTQLEDIETFLNESGFAFKESDSSHEMTLSKQVGDKTLTIVFESR